MEEINMSAGAAETEGVGADQTNVFDGWDDAHTEETQAPQEEQKQEAEAPSAEEAPGQEEQKAEEQQEKSPEEDFYLTLKHLESTRTVTKEEAQELAQKGLDYDRVKGKLEELREYQNKVGPAVTLIQRYADQSHMSIEEYLDYCRSQELVQGGLTEDQAKRQIDIEHRESAVTAREEEAESERAAQDAAKQEADTQAEQVRRDIQAFMQDYPGVSAQEIPEEVWADMMKNKVSMSVAYGKYKVKALEREVEAAKAAAEAKAKTTGSLTGSLPAAAAADPAFEGWED